MNTIERTLELPFSQERVWRAITRPEEISRWFDNHTQLEWREGGEIIFEWDDYGRVGGEIVRIDPPNQFAYRWRAHGVDEEVPMTEANSTLVTFALSPTAEGTRLTVVETGFDKLPPALRETAYRENVSGWRAEFEDLKSYFEALAV